VDLEISLVKALGWSLADIDCTDVESLIPFLNRFNSGGKGQAASKIYCDDPQADWLLR
jgi:hypothetical protein